MYLGLTAGRPTPHSLRFVAHATIAAVSVCEMCSFRVLLSACCCVTLLASTAAVYLDRRLITSATLAFPRYGGTRQGVAGCPVRRVLHPDTGELHCPLSTAACRGERAEWIVQTRGKDGGHQAECQPAPCAHNNTVLWTGECTRKSRNACDERYFTRSNVHR